jgi:MFS family permease
MLRSDRMIREPPVRMTSRWFVLVVCVLVYASSVADRQVLAVLAEYVKHDLRLSDADLGFLLGTAFAVFYAVFGIPAGRIADIWSRTRLTALGMSAWSVLTGCCALVRSFPLFALLRIGVGIGESSSSPAVYSLLYDYFPKKWHSTVFAIYSGGIFIGAGLGIMGGGFLADTWTRWFPDFRQAPLGLRGWQVTFLVLGIPGLLLAAAVMRIGERRPNRVVAPQALRELCALLPFIGLAIVAYERRWTAVAVNALLLAAAGFLAWSLAVWTGSTMQWLVVGLGIYACASAAQSIWVNDRASFRFIASRTMLVGNVGVAGCVFLTTGLLAWLPTLLQRVYGASAAASGAILGLSYLVAGFGGSLCGGFVADRWEKVIGPRARMAVALSSYLASLVITVLLVTTSSRIMATLLCVPVQFLTSMYLGPCAASVNSLVPPRMRATASAMYIATLVVFGSALGPYVMGYLSDRLIDRGYASGPALAHAILLSLVSAAPTVICLLLGLRWIRTGANARRRLAIELGEIPPDS